MCSLPSLSEVTFSALQNNAARYSQGKVMRPFTGDLSEDDHHSNSSDRAGGTMGQVGLTIWRPSLQGVGTLVHALQLLCLHIHPAPLQSSALSA